MIVNIWLMCLAFRDCTKSLVVIGDNMSVIRWMFQSSGLKKDSLYYDMLQMGEHKLATLITDLEHCLASKHTKGKVNLIANLLSWSGSIRVGPPPLASNDPSFEELTHHFHSHLPQLVSKSLKMCPLPNAILSWIIC
jgi:hypothetical protein